MTRLACLIALLFCRLIHAGLEGVVGEGDESEPGALIRARSCGDRAGQNLSDGCLTGPRGDPVVGTNAAPAIQSGSRARWALGTLVNPIGP